MDWINIEKVSNLYLLIWFFTLCFSIKRYFANCFDSCVHREIFNQNFKWYIFNIIFRSFSNALNFPSYLYNLFNDINYEKYAYDFDELGEFLLYGTFGDFRRELIREILKYNLLSFREVKICLEKNKTLIMFNLFNEFFNTKIFNINNFDFKNKDNKLIIIHINITKNYYQKYRIIISNDKTTNTIYFDEHHVCINNTIV